VRSREVGELSQEVGQRLFMKMQRIRNQLVIALNALQETVAQYNEFADELARIVQDIGRLQAEVAKLKSKRKKEEA